jgi:hypothetical protein
VVSSTILITSWLKIVIYSDRILAQPFKKWKRDYRFEFAFPRGFTAGLPYSVIPHLMRDGNDEKVTGITKKFWIPASLRLRSGQVAGMTGEGLDSRWSLSRTLITASSRPGVIPLKAVRRDRAKGADAGRE